MENTEEDVDTLIQVLTKIAKKAQSSGEKHLIPEGTTTLTKAEVQKQIDEFVKGIANRVYSE